ncbi:MAG TPA: sugar ABC transporter substrate-binding protein [Tetrasphaera sp.]|uniref:ABC transporter substrate-binding protein n=1 Tax=Nostocoides sp. TaxID=1917966 RepID=UPI002C7CA466|nr:sugar ABC transporter substrate-binding protein [Tetrasphaera sp.]HNQ05577.1 sugar ABC transporter substrate-binding protein [Tetrasphaera sp.]
MMSDQAHVNRRQMLALGGSFAAVSALAACGGNTGRTTTTSATSAAGTASSGGATSGGGAKPVLQQWYHQYGEEGTQAAVEGYAKAYTAADVKVTWKPGDYDQTTAASLLTSSGPDVFEYGNGPTIDMIKGGQVADLTGLLGDAESDFNPAMVKRMTYDGKLWAIPQVIDMQILVYRKSLLEKAGVTPPTTIDELIAAAEKLTVDKTKGLFLGNDGGVGLMGGPMLFSSGLDYLQDDGSFGFDDEKAVAALGKLREMFTSKYLLLAAPKDWYDASALTSGLTAMQFTGLWTFPSITKELGDDYGAIPWPAMPGGKPSVVVGAYGSCVNAKSQNVDAAKEFAKWLWVDQTDKQLDFATAYGFHIPARASLAAQAKTLQSGPAKDAAAAAQEFGHAQNQILWTPKCATAFSDMMTKVVKDGADAKAEIAKVKAVAEAEVKRVLG